MNKITRRTLLKVGIATTALATVPSYVLARLEPQPYYVHKEFASNAQVDFPHTTKTFSMSWTKVDDLVSDIYNCNYTKVVPGKVSHSLDVRNGISKYYIEGIEVVLKPSERVILEMT